MTTKTNFKYLVIVENFFGISRPHLIEDQRTKIICDIISITVLIIITSIIIMDFITVSRGIGNRIFELIIVIELYGLAIGSRFRKAIFDVIDRLDEKCGIDEDYGNKIRAKTIEMIIIFVPSVFMDIIGLTLMNVKASFAIFLSVAFAAHDAEMGFAALLIETINLRIENLKNNALPNIGSRIYRHILIATAYLSEQYTTRLLLMLAVTLLTTVAYEFIWVIADSSTIIHLSFYLMWRVARSIYSLWMVCSAVARTGTVCNELALHLVGRLTLDPSICKEKNPVQYKTVQRWYAILLSQRPQFISGSILSLGLSTPILLLDLSINYMLIMVQMYLAYK